MKFTQFSIACGALLLSGVSAFAGAVYLDDTSGNLYVGDPTTGAFSLVGSTGVAGGLADIDFANGVLYGIDNSQNLYSVNTTSGAATLIGGTGTEFLAGLAGDSSGNLYAGGSGDIYTLNTTTGAGTLLPGTGGQGYTVSGDLEFVGSTLYLTSADTGLGPATGGELWSVNVSTGGADELGETGQNAVWGLAYDTDNSVFYGYTSGGLQFIIDPSDLSNDTNGAEITGTSIGTDGDQLLGAAFISSAPEPSTFVLIGSGLALLALIRRRKTRQMA